jgi:CubicO group peptidase (beta-lactamase class C family)
MIRIHAGLSALLASVLLVRTVVAQSRLPLSDYQGVYAYHGTTIALVASDSMLVVVLDGAKYPLRPLGNDRFLNSSRDTIPFRRGANGAVAGFSERGVFFARRTPIVDAETIALVRARARSEPYVYRQPNDVRDGLRVGNATGAGFDSAGIARLASRIIDGTYPEVHGILVHHAGTLVLEEYFYGYDRDRPHQMRSLSKSVVSALVGIAIDRGLIASDSARALPYLSYSSYANPDPRKDSLTIRDLLTMRSGLACDDWDGNSPGNESRMYESGDWVRFVLDLPLLDRPGTHGRYCSGNVAVAGRIVERTSGKTLPAFAQEYLFAPLGIRDVRWNYTLDSTNAATFAQLYLRPRDMLKLGILFQQHGRWNGRQLIPQSWVERSTAKWSVVGDQDYGFFWWHQWVNVGTDSGPRRVDMVVATGNGGQKIYLVPSLDLIVVMTGGAYNVSSPTTTIMAKEILPAIMRSR